MKVKHLSAAVAAVATLMTATPAAAFAVACDSKINDLGISGLGAVTMNAGYGMLLICSTESTVASISSDTCKTWYSTFLTAKMTGRLIRLYFQTEDPSNAGLTQNCNQTTFGTWVWHPPYYIFIVP